MLFWKTFYKKFHKSRSSQTQQIKSIPKINISFNFYHLPISTVLDRKANTLALFLLLFFQISFLSIFVCSSFLVFYISSNKLNSISCDICLSFKSRHLQLFCKIIIQLNSIGIFLRLWLRGPPSNFIEQLVFLHNCEWLLPIIQ